jgi:hypothetical protein
MKEFETMTKELNTLTKSEIKRLIEMANSEIKEWGDFKNHLKVLVNAKR